ncbi:MAG: LCP family protein [Mogibacterium sp.]|nr:LCP family protein [Mogibacterium sp.]
MSEPISSRERIRRKKRRRRRRIRIFLLLLILILLIAIVGVLFVTRLLGKINKNSLDESKLYKHEVEGFTNILLLGVDARDMSDVDNARTDAIMIASINDETKEVTLTSIYRDTYLEMGDSGDYDKITHAHYYGGAEMSIATVNRALDLDIDKYVLVNFKCVADAIDAMDGIEVEVEDYEIEELNKYTKETARIIGREDYHLVSSPGNQTLDGCQAVAYGRIRKGVGDDFKRTDRMRLVLSKMMKKAQAMSAKDLSAVMNVVLPELQTNMSNRDMVEFGLIAKDMTLNSSKGFPYEKTTGLINGMDCVIAVDLAEDVKTLHREIFGEAEYEPSETVLEISQVASYY